MDYLANLTNTFQAEVEARVGPEALEAGAVDAPVAIPAFHQLGGIPDALDALDSMGDRPEPELLNQGWLALLPATAPHRATAEFARLERESS
jgi:hypothetical protein